MWSTSEDPPGVMEGEPPEATANTREKCEQNKNQLESLKEIMMRNQQSLKKKEEEVQEYARRLSKIKSRAKLSRRSKEGSSSSKDTVQSPKTESAAIDTIDDAIDDISQAKTPKAKSSLLQRKLAENRKAFEQRSKELTETKRAVEEKVEAIRQQLEETDLVSAEMHRDQVPVTPVRPLMVTSDIMSPIQIQDIQEKEGKIIELNNKILELEATVLDLQENLKEKDSVIDSKTKAITLMSADLSKKGKTTLDTLEDTKDEMRMMQENFVLIETSLKNKNTSLLEQLQDRDNRITDLEQTVNRFEEQLREQKIAESASADFSRSTMDTLAETKDAMKSMQENFVLIESSLKMKNDNLLQQLGEYETKLVEAKERIFQLESGVGIVTTPTVEDLQFKIDRLEQSNRQLVDEKYELQKDIAELQDRVIASRSTHDDSEKDNKIAELERSIEELKRSNELLDAESKAELHQHVADLSSKNEDYSNRITDLEKQVHELEAEKDKIAKTLSDERTMPREDDKVIKLTKGLEDLNKSMIKLKAQHRSKVKGLQKQLENFKMVSDTNAELVKLGNQVALLEEEKGNLQLSLVDFDELKASAGDWQERVADFENKVSSQTKEIQMHIDAIATLENQKLDLMQELHTVKQEVSALEAENAESENLRVTAEMKVVELEEQLEATHKEQSESKLESLPESEYNELLKKIDALTQENSELYNKLSKLEEKGASDTGSTESFEAIQVNDRNDLLKKIEDLEQKNNELTLKLSKLEEKDSSHAGSTESFETINDTDRGELLKKIEQLTQENSDLTMKLSRIEEKGSSDTGSTESFERIPEHNESTTKIELLTQENLELVIKLTKLEEQLSRIESDVRVDVPKKIDDTMEALRQENDYLTEEISKLKEQIEEFAKENSRLQDHMEELTAEKSRISEVRAIEFAPPAEIVEQHQIFEKESLQSREIPLEQSVDVTSCVADDTRTQLATLKEENAQMIATLAELKEYIASQKEEMSRITKEKDELNLKLERVACDDVAEERLELIDKLEKLTREKESVAQERHDLHEEISTLRQKSSDEISEIRKAEETACQESQAAIVTSLEREVENSRVLLADYRNQIEEMNMKIRSMEVELQEKAQQLQEHEVSGAKIESLEQELRDMFATAEEWKFKYNDMQAKMQVLEEVKMSIEEAFKTLESNNKDLMEVIKEKDAETTTMQERLHDMIGSYETRMQDELVSITEKERENADLKAAIENKSQELRANYSQLQNDMIIIDNLQDELNNCTMKLKENEIALSSSLEEAARLNAIMGEKEEEIQSLKIIISDMKEKSKPLAEFNAILDNLQSIEENHIELQTQHENVLQTNEDLRRRVEDMSRRDEDLKNELIKKEQEIAELFTAKEDVVAQIEEITGHKTEAEKKNWELQAILDNQIAYVEKVQSDLTNEYKQMEQLKIKHMEDIAMLNHRLEDVIEELTVKVQENESLKAILEQKEQLLGENVTEETSAGQEGKIAELEQKLLESENKLQAQSEKMKKIVATFNKKKLACQELEARVAELEEKWTTEKDEKEMKNKKIQEVENSMREKDNKIADLEERLLQAKNDTAEVHSNLEKLTKESSSLKEKMSVLMEQIAEMDDEIERQRAEMDLLHQQVETEKATSEDIARQYDQYKETVSQESEHKQMVLDEVKEEARELSVRMQVMENEYVEQLALIKNLQAENGLLSSKQTQINEKLENAEKESEERRVLIEQLQKKIVSTMTVGVQISEEEMRESDMRDTQRCDHSEQCQNLVQALETRLQERQAEIDNLNNELANSYGNIVLLHDESSRYNDMMMQTAQERFNQSLMDQTNTLRREIDSLRTEKTMSELRVSELEAELNECKYKSVESKEEVAKSAEALVADSQRQREPDDTPQLFDASKIFGAVGAPSTDASDKNEIVRLRGLLHEREVQCSQHMNEMDLLVKSMEEERSYVQKLQAQCDDQVGHWKNRLEDVQDELTRAERLHSEKVDSLNGELNKVTLQLNEFRSSQEQHYGPHGESQKLRELLSEKDAQIDSLVAELDTVSQQLNMQQLHANVDASLRIHDDVVALQTELASTTRVVEALTAERDHQNVAMESYKLQIDNLEAEMKKRANDSDLIQELEERVSVAITDRDLLQLQVNELLRTLEESREKSAKELDEKLTVQQQESKQVSSLAEEQIVHQEHAQLAQVPAEKEMQQKQETPFAVDSKWDDDFENVDEVSWDWSAENAQLASDRHLASTTTLFPNNEVRLRVQVEDLQDRIQDLEAENAKIVEESKAAQVKSGKLVKKLKEYKVQVESLQQQLKTQKQTDNFFNLDTAIEEELKTQIANLEKALNEIKDEKKNIVTEKEALLKRLDVVVSANERYMEMKERQDMEVEVLRIQNKELSNKVQSLEWRLQENVTDIEEDTISVQHEVQQVDTSSHEMETTAVHGQPQKRSIDPADDLEALSSKYKEEIDDLKDELEALAAENEQLQHVLEEQKATIMSLESRSTDNIVEITEKFETLNNQYAQSQSALIKSKEDYDILRKQYEQSLMDANDQVAAMRQNSELLKIEFSEKVERLESEVNNLQKTPEEKEVLEGRISALTGSEEKLSAVDASAVEAIDLLNIRVQEVANLKQELHNLYLEKKQAEATLQSEIENLMRTLDECKKEMSTFQQICNDMEHQLMQQKSVETMSAIVSEATQELVQKHAIEIEEKGKELHGLTEKLTTLQSTVDEYASKLRDNMTSLETQQQQIAYLKEDLMERDLIIESTKTDADSTREKLLEKQEELTRRDEECSKLTAELDRCLLDIQHLQSRLSATEATTTTDLQEYHSHIHHLEQQIQTLNSEKESITLHHDQKTKTYQEHLEDYKLQIDTLTNDLREKTEHLHQLGVQMCAKENDLERIKSAIADKDTLLNSRNQELNEKRAELERFRSEQPQSSKMIDGLPVFRMGNDDDLELQRTVDELKAQMEAKQQELDHLKHVLSEDTYPTIIQQMQDRINCLYNEKVTLEASLRTAEQTLTEKQEQVHLLTQRVNEQNQEHTSKEEANMLSRDRRSAHDQEEIVRLQNELHVKEQEINELQYVIAEKDSQLALQASMEPQSDEFELRETVQRLTGELYGKEQEVQTLKATIAELQNELSRFKDLERLSEESRSAIERLHSEKEQIRIEAEEFLSRELQKKEMEIGEIKQQLSEENQQLLAELRSRNSDIENLKMQLTRLRDEWSDRLQRKENELMQTADDLTEKERRLTEVSVTKDTMFHNLKMQINEKEARIEELLALSAEEELQLDELRQTLMAKETELGTMKELLDQKVSEYELIQHALKKDVSVIEAATSRSSETDETTDNKETTSNELDFALYMLHQRDVRCEELTHELMQLLEERDTLQLRLSNAIRVNEELRKANSIEASPVKDSTPAPLTIVEPLVEQPSPSRSEGPVEIAKEAIDDPIENKEALALKLSQLHSVSHTKDIRLKDERELRHTQQMSLLAHRDVLSTLPSEAAARLVNANYTLSRDVRSQSSVLLNWLWGKSTPKVVHM